MADKILVAYATRYGSTREVAEKIGNLMSSSADAVEVRDVEGVDSLDGYSAVVLGVPLYIGSMLKGAQRFLERHRERLETLPTAFFVLGPLQGTDDMDEARKQLDKVWEKYPWFKPAEVEMFVGAYDPATLRFLDKLATKPPASPLHGLEAHDDRDWDAIGAWATKAGQALGA